MGRPKISTFKTGRRTPTVSEPSPLEEREVRLFKNGVNQALRIPKEFELPGDSALMRKENGCLIIRPTRQPSLAELLDSWGPLHDDFPEISDLPTRSVTLSP